MSSISYRRVVCGGRWFSVMCCDVTVDQNSLCQNFGVEGLYTETSLAHLMKQTFKMEVGFMEMLREVRKCVSKEK